MNEPAWFKTLAETLQHNLAAARPPLAGTPLDASRYRAAMETLFDPELLSIDGASCYVDEDVPAVGIQGAAELFGRPSLPVRLGYRGVADACYFDMTVSPGTWEPLGGLQKLGLPLEDIQLHWRYGPLAAAAASDPVLATSHLQFSATASLAGLEVPLTLVPPQRPGPSELWQLSGDFEAVPLQGLAPLVQWITQAAGAPALPALEKLSGLALSGLGLSFDPAKARLNSALVAVAVTAPWPVLGQSVVLDDVVLALGFAADEQGGYDVHADVTAAMVLGEQTLEVHLAQDSGLGLAVLELSSDDAVLPSFDALAKLAGLPELARHLPPPLRALSGLLIEDFRIELDTKAGTLSHLGVSLACTDPVAITPTQALENTRLALSVTPGAASPVSGHLSAMLVLGSGDHLALEGAVQETLELSGGIDALSLSALASLLPGGLPEWFPELDLEDVSFQLGREVHFEAAVSMDFEVLARSLKIPVPTGMTHIDLSSLSLDLDLSDSTWNIGLATDQTYQFPHAGEHQLALRDVALSFGVDGSGALRAGGSFTLDGSVALGPDVQLSVGDPGLHASFGGGTWALKGPIDVEAFGTSYPGWQAKIEQGSFRLFYDGQPLKPVSWDGVALAQIDTFEIAVVEHAGQGGAGWGFDVSGDGRMRLADGHIDVPAHLEIDTSSQRLVFSSPNPHIPPLSVGALILNLQLEDLRLCRDDGWSFGSAATLSLDGIPEPLARYLPRTRAGSLAVTKTGVTLSCTTDGWDIDFGPLAIKLGDREIPLGEPEITPTGFDVVLGDTPSAAAHLHVKIPRELNRLLGWDEHFAPRTIFLNPAVDLRLGAGKKGFELALENGTSPLKALKIDEEGYARWVLGEVGTFEFKVPVMTFDETKGTWSASFGMRRDGPLRFPLQPVRFLMRVLGIPGETFVPRSVPIPDDIDLLKLGDELKGLVGPEVWAAVRKKPVLAKLLDDLFEAINAVAHEIQEKYPTDFLDYLTLHVPETITFDLQTSGRGPSFTLRTEDEAPLKFLLPWFAAVPPGLTGFTLREVSFGQALGTLGLLKVDGHADFFDFVTLVVAALPSVEARGFRNRLTADHLTAVVPSAFPFPIPLFYDHVRWELKSWTELGVTTDWRLPAEIDLFETGGVLIDFFSKRDYLLSRDAKDKAIEVDFQIGPNFIALPAYAGGGTIGPETGAPVLPLGDSFKRLLDTFKTGNLGYLIEAVPLRDPKGNWIRIGKKAGSVEFGPLTFEAGIGWCIVTDTELRQEILPNPEAKAMLGALDAEDVLHSIPTRATGPAYEKGFLVMLMGACGVRPILEAQGYWGMALTAGSDHAPENEGGFETGFLLQGRIAESLALTIRGDLQIARDRTTTIEGHCTLAFLNLTLIDAGAHVTVGDGLFELGVVLQLAGDACRLEGTFHIGRDQIFICGAFEWHYAPGHHPMAAASATARFDPTGFAIELKAQRLFGVDASVTLYVDARQHGRMGARASLDVSAVSGYFLNSFSDLAKETAKEVAATEQTYKAAAGKYNGHMSLIEGLQVFLRKLAGDLPKIVLQQVNHYLDTHTVLYPHKAIRNQAKDEAGRVAGQLKSLAGQLGQADAEKAKKLILGLIDTVLKARVKITAGPITLLDKSIWVWAPKAQKTKLQEARGFLKDLPAEKLAKAEAKQVYDRYVAQHDYASEIAQAVAHQVTDALPKLEELRWETETLVSLTSTSTLAAVVTYKGSERRLGVPFDLSKPAESAPAIGRALIDALSSPQEGT